MLGNAAASDGEPSLLSRTSNVEELFRHHFRTVERIYNAFGTAGVRQHRDNISGACLVSLFSGLGGAELAMEQNFVACCWMCERLGLPPPNRPRLFAEIHR